MSRWALVLHKAADSSATWDQSDISLFIDPPFNKEVTECLA